MNPLLSQDMAIVENLYGTNAINHRMFGTIDDIDIELNVNMGFLDVSICRVGKRGGDCCGMCIQSSIFLDQLLFSIENEIAPLSKNVNYTILCRFPNTVKCS